MGFVKILLSDEGDRTLRPGKQIAMVLMLCGLAAVAAGCRSTRHGAVSAIGSTSIQPFAEMLAEEFNTLDPNYYIEVQGGGSTAGLQAVANHIAEIGMCSRALTAEETESYDPIVIAWDGLAVVVHPDNPINELSLEQIRQIFSGHLTDWSQLPGGKGGLIHVITREEGSGTREAFQKLVMHDQLIGRKAVTQESNGAVKELVWNDPGTIGYMSLGLIDKLKAISIVVKDKDPNAPPAIIHATSENITSQRYPLRRPFLFVTTKGAAMTPGAKLFVDFVLSPKGQSKLQKQGLVPIREARKAD